MSFELHRSWQQCQRITWELVPTQIVLANIAKHIAQQEGGPSTYNAMQCSLPQAIQDLERCSCHCLYCCSRSFQGLYEPQYHSPKNLRWAVFEMLPHTYYFEIWLRGGRQWIQSSKAEGSQATQPPMRPCFPSGPIGLNKGKCELPRSGL